MHVKGVSEKNIKRAGKGFGGTRSWQTSESKFRERGGKIQERRKAEPHNILKLEVTIREQLKKLRKITSERASMTT